jgi:hypothetical protein
VCVCGGLHVCCCVRAHCTSRSLTIPHQTAATLQVCLPAIWALSFLLVTYRLGVLPAESAASLKLLDKGVGSCGAGALTVLLLWRFDRTAEAMSQTR